MHPLTQRRRILPLLTLLLAPALSWGQAGEAVSSPKLLSYYNDQVIARAAGPGQWQWHPMAIGSGGNNIGMTFSATDPDRMYIRIDVAGVIQSYDGGKHWRNTNIGIHGLGEGNYGIGALVIHPKNPKIMYASAGRDWKKCSGIIRSEDGGESWQWWSGDIFVDGGGATARKYGGPGLLIHPDRPDVMYGIDSPAKGGVWQSDDAGRSWHAIGLPKQFVTTIRFAPGNPDTIFASCRDDDSRKGGFFFSTDAGKSWQQGDLPRQVFNFVFDSGDPRIIYATTGADGLYKSTDAGRTWSPMNNGLPLAANGDHDRFYPADYKAIDADPSTPGHLITANYMMDAIYESHDGGATWQARKAQKTTASPGWLLPLEPLNHFAWHTNQIYFNPHDPKRWFLCDFFGTWQSPDAGATWDIRPYGMETSCMVGVLPDVEIPNRFYMGIWDHDMVIYLDDDKAPRTVRVKNLPHWATPGTNSHVSGIAQDAAHPERMIAVNNSAVVSISEDRGQTWQKIDSGLPQNATFRIGRPAIASQAGKWYLPINGDTQNGGGVYVSADFGRTWRRASCKGLDSIDVTGRWDPRQNVFDVSPDGTLMTLASNGKLYTSADGAESWSQATLAAPVSVTALVPSHPSRILAGSANGGGLWRSDDSGASWKQLWTGPGNVELLAADGKHAARILIYTEARQPSGRVDQRLLLSEDDGATWAPVMNDSLAIWKLRSVAFDPFNPDKFYAGTYWGGTWVALRPQK